MCVKRLSARLSGGMQKAQAGKRQWCPQYSDWPAAERASEQAVRQAGKQEKRSAQGETVGHAGDG